MNLNANNTLLDSIDQVPSELLFKFIGFFLCSGKRAETLQPSIRINSFDIIIRTKAHQCTCIFLISKEY
jgi:hypothetical protein